MKTETLAELYRGGRIIRRYLLKHDDRGYYFDGMDCASFRRKTREVIERRAARSHFDIVEREAI